MKLDKILLLASILFTLPFCSSGNTSRIESLSSPVIIVIKNDSIVEVRDSKGQNYMLYTVDKLDYRTAFLDVGDTLEKQRK